MTIEDQIMANMRIAAVETMKKCIELAEGMANLENCSEVDGPTALHLYVTKLKQISEDARLS